MTDISSCVIAKCLTNVAAIMYLYTNCNETADAFFCKQGILSNDKGDNLDRLPYKHILFMS
jgi:hypothetical protein